jgi:hypothetical protein
MFYLDDTPTEVEAETLGQALAAAQTQLGARGRLLVEVQIDGVSVTGPALDDRAEQSLDGAEVRFYSAQPGELALATLGQVRQRLDDIRTAQADAADLLQRDEPAQAFTTLSTAIDGWIQVQQAVQGVAALLGVRIAELDAPHDTERAPSVAGESAAIGELVQALRAVKPMLADRDTVGLADALTYEWPALTERWERIVDGLRQRIQD